MQNVENTERPIEKPLSSSLAKDERKKELRESMPQCFEIVQAFAVFDPRVMEMEEIRSGIVWRREK